MKEVKISTVIGFLCFIALMLAGGVWLLSLIPGDSGFQSVLAWLKNISVFLLIACALVFGWIWLYESRMNKTLKIVLMVFFILFAVLAVVGVIR